MAKMHSKWLKNAYFRLMQTKRDPWLNDSLSIIYCKFQAMSSRQSLPDTEPLKDIPQDFVGGDFAEDGGEVVEGLAEVFGEKVGGLGGG